MQKFVEAGTAAAAAHFPSAHVKDAVRSYARHCAAYRQPSGRSAALQLLSTLIPLLLIAGSAIYVAQASPLLALPLAIPLGGLLVRCFIIQHDCGHGSFVGSQRANAVIGTIMSVLTLTPYALWRRVHAMHHAGSGNLDRRGAGDIKTLTVDEYLRLDRLGRLRYRIYRNPAFLFLVGAPAFFLFLQRQPWGHPVPARECWRSIMLLNIALVALYGGLGWLVGPLAVLAVAMPAIMVAAALGGWLFFVQHQFEETHWQPSDTWDFQVAALHGSSYYDLPAVLHWFTGNIGLHHIHHLNCMIPNYRLRECLAAAPDLAHINRITLADSLRCARLSLWDPATRRLIGFSDLSESRAAHH